MSDFTHLDAAGNAVMVDVSGKPESVREAVAEGFVAMEAETLALIRDGGLAKGDVLGVARLAGIMGAKRTADLIPLCHPLGLDAVSVTFDLDPERGGVAITARCRVTGRTGVEMEALTAVSVAALTLYDMCKSRDRGMVIGPIRLIEKTGGKSGPWRAQTTPPR